jgi:hypothetical protein
MLNSPDLLSARNLILASAAVLVLSVLGMCISMLRPVDSGGLARDTYGTRAGGYRALVEILQELGVNASRSVSPPQPDANDRKTLVLLDPNPRLVAVGPKYAQSMRKWIETGGRVVVTPSTSNRDSSGTSESSANDDRPTDILQALGVDDQVSVGTGADGNAEADFTDGREAERDDDSSNNDWSPWNGQPAEPPRQTRVLLTGSLEPLKEDIREIALPGDETSMLIAKPEDLAGSITYANPDNKEDRHLLVAVLKRGAGEIVVVADPAIVSNELIARADNSVLAVHLLSPHGNAVVFDEFYHGLAVRGNPFYLLTRPGFAAATVGLLAIVGTLAWRLAVFLGPPLDDPKATRRDIGEYVNAMAAFFSRGRDSRRFIVQEVRDGVLRQVCREMRLPMDTLDVETITSALARHDRKRAERLAAVMREVDAGLAASREFPRSNYLPVMQRLASCL